MEIGIFKIDSQHRELIERLNAVTAMGAKSVSKEETDKTFTFSANPNYIISKVLIDGMNDPFAVEAGVYTFIKVQGDHTIQVSCILDVNIDENYFNEIRIYTDGKTLYVESDDNNKANSLLCVYDVTGKTVLEKIIQPHRFSVSLPVSAGSYFVTLSCDRKIYSCKININQ